VDWVGAGLAQAEGAFRSSDCVLPADGVGYSVIDMDRGYQLAAVSDAKRAYLWILSRSPKVDKARYAALVGRLAGQGLDVRKLATTEQE